MNFDGFNYLDAHDGDVELRTSEKWKHNRNNNWQCQHSQSTGQYRQYICNKRIRKRARERTTKKTKWN